MTILKKGVFPMFTQNQTCIMQSSCTDCSFRADCKWRKLFYSEDLYKEYQEELSTKIRTEAANLGLSEKDISLGVKFIIHAVDAHRAAELLENPAYSA